MFAVSPIYQVKKELGLKWHCFAATYTFMHIMNRTPIELKMQGQHINYKLKIQEITYTDCKLERFPIAGAKVPDKF